MCATRQWLQNPLFAALFKFYTKFSPKELHINVDLEESTPALNTEIRNLVYNLHEPKVGSWFRQAFHLLTFDCTVLY